MNILSWLVFGLIVGIAANFVDPEASRGSLLGSVVLGIIGALVGGFIGDALFGVPVTGFNITSFLLAVVGSLILLVVGRSLRRA